MTADFEFDYPVRFDADLQEIALRTHRHHDWANIGLVELRDLT